MRDGWGACHVRQRQVCCCRHRRVLLINTSINTTAFTFTSLSPFTFVRRFLPLYFHSIHCVLLDGLEQCVIILWLLLRTKSKCLPNPCPSTKSTSTSTSTSTSHFRLCRLEDALPREGVLLCYYCTILYRCIQKQYYIPSTYTCIYGTSTSRPPLSCPNSLRRRHLAHDDVPPLAQPSKAKAKAALSALNNTFIALETLFLR